MKNKWFLLVLALILLVALSGCGSPNPMTNIPLEETGQIYGFWKGLWDGLTIIFAFLGSLLGYDINIYEVHNNGGLYNFGFMIGAGLFANSRTWLKIKI